MKIIFATANEGKMREIRRIADACGNYYVCSPKEAGIMPEINENGTSFEENALIKVRAVGPQEDALVMADDSGIEIDAFQGAPGVYSARFMGEDTPYTVKNRAILDRMQGLTAEERGARYRCVIALLFPDGTERVFEDCMEGRITEGEPRGEGGFGYDPIFYVPEANKTAAELTDSEKDAVSHRGKALRKAFLALQTGEIS
ncbi:MAG: RdgB/HAM1 family non-canonical purine NTP pyrophosphatase [Lachnospiraceae bacterium]|nr:RdgB/HAM1 family non-canonical purine NTP pyrophosphatase [Lachnospiraceae bacterium]